MTRLPELGHVLDLAHEVAVGRVVLVDHRGAGLVPGDQDVDLVALEGPLRPRACPPRSAFIAFAPSAAGRKSAAWSTTSLSTALRYPSTSGTSVQRDRTSSTSRVAAWAVTRRSSFRSSSRCLRAAVGRASAASSISFCRPAMIPRRRSCSSSGSFLNSSGSMTSPSRSGARPMPWGARTRATPCSRARALQLGQGPGAGLVELGLEQLPPGRVLVALEDRGDRRLQLPEEPLHVLAQTGRPARRDLRAPAGDGRP